MYLHKNLRVKKKVKRKVAVIKKEAKAKGIPLGGIEQVGGDYLGS